MAEASLLPDRPILRLRDGDAEIGVAIQPGNSDMELRDLAVEVPRHQALPQEFDAVHFGLCAASAVISALSIARQTHPKDAAEKGSPESAAEVF